MNKLKKLILLNFILLLASCGTMKSAFENQKKNNTDEFLVEKKSPLVMPPDFDELPLPENINVKQDENKESDIKSLISNTKDSSSENQKNSNQNINFENSIIDKIKKN